MLDNTIAYFNKPLSDGTTQGTLTKMSADEQTGTRYRDLGTLPTGIASRLLLIKHQGNQSSQKHLISFQTEVQKVDMPRVRCTVNITVTAHPTLTAGDIQNELMCALSSLVSDTSATNVIVPTEFLQHGLQGAY